MNNSGKTTVRRLLSILLVVVMCIGVIPLPVFAYEGKEQESVDGVRLYVVDNANAPLKDADVSYTVDSKIKEQVKSTGKTDDNGYCEVIKNEDYVADDLTLSYKVEKDGYSAVSVDNVEVTSASQLIQVKMQKVITGVTVTPASKVYNGIAVNAVTVSGTQEGDTVTYNMDSAGWESECPEITEPGSYSVAVTVKRDGYADYVVTVSAKIEKMTFSPDVNVYGKDDGVDFDGEGHTLVSISNFPDEVSPEYKLSTESSYSQTCPSKENAGTYTVNVHFAETAHYKEFSANYTSKINAVDIDGLSIEYYSGTYDKNSHKAFTVKKDGNVLGDGYTVEYKEKDGAWTEGTPDYTNAGEYELEVRVKSSSSNYKVTSLTSGSVNIAKAKQTNFDFVTNSYPKTLNAKNTVAYDFTVDDNNKYVFAAAGTDTDGVVSYSVENIADNKVDVKDMAEITETGELKVKAGGCLCVKATKKGNNNYEDCVIEYNLFVTVEEDDLIKFSIIDKTYTLGTSNGVVSDAVVTKKYSEDNGVVTYSVADVNGIAVNGLAVDKNGKITVTDYDAVGSALETANGALNLIVKAEKTEGSEKYGESSEKNIYAKCEATYKLFIRFEATPSNPVTLTGEKEEWSSYYKSNVTITPVSGYEISDNFSTFAESIEVSSQGLNEKTVYLRSTFSNGITAPVKVESFSVDTVSPDANKMSVDYSSEQGKQNTVSGKDYYKDGVTVTLTAFDETSGIKEFKWTFNGADGGTKNGVISGTDIVKYEADKTKFTAQFTVPCNEKGEAEGNVSFTVVDNAGNESSIKTDSDTVVVIDKTNPDCTVKYETAEGVKLNDSVEGRKYFDGKLTVTLTIKETNFDKDGTVVKLMTYPSLTGEASTEIKDVEWTYNEDTKVYTTSVELSGDGYYKVSVSSDDFAKNNGTAETDYIIIDSVKPVLTAEYSQETEKITVTVDELNFFAEDVEIVGECKDIKLETVDISEDLTTLNNALHNADSWTVNGNKHTIEISTADYTEGNYSLTAKYSDKSGNSATDVDFNMLTDCTAPYDVSIAYETPFNLRNIIRFYNRDVEITFTAYDDDSGVKSFVYEIPVTDGASGSNVKYQQATVDAVQDKDDSSKYTATVTLPKSEADYVNGYVIYKAVDNLGNETELYNDGTNNIVVVDKELPNVEIIYKPTDTVSADENIMYYPESAESPAFAVVNIEEVNFDESNVVFSITKDGNVVETPSDYVVWSVSETNEDLHIATVTFPEFGNYQFTVTATDFAHSNGDVNDNVSVTSKEIHVDSQKPVISKIEYSDEAVSTDEESSVAYYNKGVTVKFTVTERNFDAENVDISITAENYVGSKIDLGDYAALVHNNENWVTDETDSDVHTFTYELVQDAIYTIDIECEDILGNKSDDYEAEKVCVDTQSPENVNIVFSEENRKVFDDVLSGLTFGVYKTEVSATVSILGDDITSGIKYFSVDITEQGSANSTDVELPVDLKISPDGEIYSGECGFISDIQAKEEDGLITLTFDIPANFRGMLSVSAVDMAGNVYDSDKSTEGNQSYAPDFVVVTDTVSPAVSITYSGTKAADVVADKDGVYSRATTDAANGTWAIYSSAVVAEIKATEANFYEDAEITVTKNGVKVDNEGLTQTEWTKTENDDEYVKTITLSDDGDYVISITYSDRSENEMNYTSSDYEESEGTKTYTSNVITIDKTAPVYEITYDNNNVIQTIGDNEYYSANRTATVKVTDRCFRPDEVVFNVTAKDVSGNDVDFTYSSLTSWSDWKSTGKNEWTAVVTFDVDANYTVEFEYSDIACNKVNNKYTKSFTVDKVAPVVNVEFSDLMIPKLLSGITFGYYKGNTKVTLTVNEQTAGIEYISFDVEKEGSENATNINLPVSLKLKADGTVYGGEAGFVTDVTANTENGVTVLEFEIPAEFRGFVSASAVDKSMNQFDNDEETEGKQPIKPDYVVVTDTISPVVSISYSGSKAADVVADKDGVYSRATTDAANGTWAIYSSVVKAEIKATEANFYEDAEITVTKNGIKVDDEQLVQSEWKKTENDDEYVKTITLSDDGDYVISMTYSDRSENEMDYTSSDYEESEGTKTYTSNVITIDKTAPVYEITYDNNNVIQTIGDNEYYSANRTATVKVTDHCFRPDEIVFNVSAKDISGKDVEYTYSRLTSWDDWTLTGTDEWTAVVPFDSDANYIVSFSYSDIAGNSVKDNYKTYFTVDKTDPEIEITYSESVVSRILDLVTFGFYGSNVEVTLTGKDNISGIEHFEWKYIQQNGTSDTNAKSTEYAVITPEAKDYSEDKTTATVSFTVDAQARGYIDAFDVDNSHNSVTKTDNDIINVVDTVSPVVSVEYVYDNDIGKQFVNDKLETVDTFEEATGVYFDNSVKAVITVNEANFFETTGADNNENNIIHNFGIVLKKTYDDGRTEYIEYLVDGAEGYSFGNITPTGTASAKWVSDKDTHTLEIPFNDDADYTLIFEYADSSANKAEIKSVDGISSTMNYESKTVTVDTVKPVMSVEYTNTDVINNIDGRDYFDSNNSVIITVTEHNFRASDFAGKVNATDIYGKDVKSDNETVTAIIDKELKNPGNWKQDGNVYTATIDFDIDANYVFDFDYKDLAGNVMDDYEGYAFTVDKVAPSNMRVTYSTSVFESVLGMITFGFYDAKMKVTLVAEDNIAGVYHYDYNYKLADGVSVINAELMDQKINSAEVTQDDVKKNTFYASFYIPQSVLRADNQFNGFVDYVVYDRAENMDVAQDLKRIVVDNIAPVGSIEYSTPVNTSGSVSYYDGDITGTIKIKEANFYSDQFVFTVNGSDWSSKIKWTHESVDNHTGTFTISGDGDYVVKMSYADYSGNKMVDASGKSLYTYQSNQLTIDTKAPVITVSEVANMSANNADKISIRVTFTDRNLSVEDCIRNFSVFVKREVSERVYTYESQTLSLSNYSSSTDSSGNTVYSFVIDNIDADGYYSLSCSVTDLSNHSVDTMSVENSQGGTSTVESMNFSVNREGSVYWIETTHNDKYTNTEYKNELNGAYANDKVNVVLHEINVDSVDMDENNKTVFLLNDGTGAKDYALIENDNYTKNANATSSCSGGWFETTYKLKNDNAFAQDGRYSFNIVSYDTATNSNTNANSEHGSISFVVDRTQPVISANIENGTTQNVTQYGIIFKVEDANFNEDTIKITCDGNDITSQCEKLSSNEYKYTVSDITKSSFTVECEDLASNPNVEYQVDDVTVTSSKFIAWYVNHEILFWSLVGGGIAITVSAVVFIILRKRKK